jgi:hypothetical protein
VKGADGDAVDADVGWASGRPLGRARQAFLGRRDLDVRAWPLGRGDQELGEHDRAIEADRRRLVQCVRRGLGQGREREGVACRVDDAV